MFEYVTLMCSLIYLIITLYGYYNKRSLEYISWLISSIAFFVLSLALVVIGLKALELPYTVYLGSIYPSFLALGLLIHGKSKWRYYLYFIIIMFLLIVIGQVTMRALKIVSQVTLHSVSGLIIVFLPLIYFVLKKWPVKYLLFSLGGITIGIGGLALASISAGAPILPPELVVALLHPLLFTSVILISIGILITFKSL